MCLNKLNKLKFSLGEEDNTLLHKSSLVDMKKAALIPGVTMSTV